ncbi:MAG: RNA-binding protein [Candidatus Thiodiazotropha sp. (ex Gloverina cf. vestifex)]|nr:RNA-binding protein [Candidatus Thiodiazotropha sp. (ex Gloverina cf. vestifex)]
MKILLRNLSRETTEAEMLSLLKEYGDVQYCKLVMDKATGKSKGFGFAEISRVGEAKAAIKGLNGRDVGGNKIRVKKAEKHEESSSKKDSEAVPNQSVWQERIPK